MQINVEIYYEKIIILKYLYMITVRDQIQQ